SSRPPRCVSLTDLLRQLPRRLRMLLATLATLSRELLDLTIYVGLDRSLPRRRLVRIQAGPVSTQRLVHCDHGPHVLVEGRRADHFGLVVAVEVVVVTASAVEAAAVLCVASDFIAVAHRSLPPISR